MKHSLHLCEKFTIMKKLLFPLAAFIYICSTLPSCAVTTPKNKAPQVIFETSKYRIIKGNARNFQIRHDKKMLKKSLAM